ncbi:MAG: hypothetical protein AUG16_03460 [Thaumarchaeota archaeon 13_1_20CM_2_39_20]|nr:MAG: hypothetical protein AUG16_03460 [Thaumarchaeota archaeon 13_1_20CM_2_39_20]
MEFGSRLLMTKSQTKPIAIFGAIFVAAMLTLVVANVSLQANATTTTAADKIGVATSALAITPLTQAVAGTSSSDVTLLSANIKTATPVDLIITHSQECSLLTNVSLSSKQTNTSGFSTSSANAQEQVSVLLDGNPIPVASGDNGQVTFCDRTFYVSTNVLSQIQQLCTATSQICAESQFNSYIKTRDAHSFQWITLNVGSGTHTITIVAHLTVNVSDSGSAMVVVGKRTMTVEPDHLANSLTL